MYNLQDMIDSDFDGIYNNVFIVGDIVGVEGEGIYSGIRQKLVLIKTTRKGSKSHYVTVILPHCESTEKLIRNRTKVMITGKIDASFTFNTQNVKHMFIKPYGIKELPRDFSIEDTGEFYIDYTIYNRVILEGEVVGTPTKKLIKSSGLYLYKFKIKFLGEGNKYRTANCTLWETVKDNVNIKEGLNIRIISCLSVNSDNIISIDDSIKKGQDTNIENNSNTFYNYYNLIVQKIYDLDKVPDNIVRRLYNI